MKTPSSEIINCESASVRIAPGEYFEFPIVDNKGLFPNYFRANSVSNFQLHCNFVDNFIYALYLRKADICYLICSWEKKEEMNDEAIKYIKTNPKLHHLLN